MVLQFGRVGLNCEVEYTKEEFVNQFSSTLAITKHDVNDCFKKYKKEYDKLNPKPFKAKKKKEKEA
jgi:hypothetical protein